MRMPVTVITSLTFAACAPGDAPGGGPIGSPARIAAPTFQQVAFWEAWREARTPSEHIRAQLSDSEGARWDCVDIEHQPAFRRATLARARRAAEIVDTETSNGRTISQDEVAAEVDAEFSTSALRDISETEARESLTIAFTEIEAAVKAAALSGSRGGEMAGQSDSRSEADISGSCPVGTVPIESWSTDQIALFGTLEAFLSPAPPAGGSQANHEYGMMGDSGSFTGGKGFINIWDPDVEMNSEFSLAQIWAWRGTGASTQTVEAGWQDYYGRTLSHKPRLFVFSTSDGYATGCYNNNCGDWVQTTCAVSLNQTWSTFSTDGGSQYSDEYGYWRGTTTGNWHFEYNGTIVGHYPSELFDSAGLLNTASRFDIGGEIINNNTGGSHTETDMGSGQFPSAGWTHAAYVRNVLSRTTTPSYVDFDVDGSDGDEPGCYDILTGDSPGGWDVYAYFGGPGYHPSNCP